MGDGRNCTRRAGARRPLALALVVALLAAIGVAATAHPAAAAGTTVPMATFRDLLVDPIRGDVLVSGDDRVAFFSADGIYQTSITAVAGAGGMDIAGNTLWVAETGDSAIAEIDLTTRTVKRTIDVGVPVTGSSLAAIGAHVWFAGDGTLYRLDPATSTVSARGDVLLGEFEEVVSSPTTLLTHDVFGSVVQRVDVSTNPATLAPGWGPPIPGVQQVAVDPSRQTYVPAGQWPTMPETSIATFTGTGVEYATVTQPVAAAYTPGRAGWSSAATAPRTASPSPRPGRPG